MKTLRILSLILSAAAIVSCGSGSNDEPDSEVITRVQDGDGKVFLENGQLVTATTNYTKDQLEDAFANYEWEREYVFYYDNKHISDRTEHVLSPHKIHTDGTIEYDSTFHRSHKFAKIGYTLNGKKIITNDQSSALSSYLVSPDTLKVVAIDFSGTEGGRIITDMTATWTVDGFNGSSKQMRMVWNGVRQ